MGRVTGAIAIFLGAIVVGFNPNRWDRVILDLPRGHGVHIHEVIGMAFITLGIALMWWAGRPQSPVAGRSASATDE